MKAEKVVLSFVAILVGLIAAGVAFYLYQATKTLPESEATPLTAVVSPTPSDSDDKYLLNIETPRDEEVFDKKNVTIKGKTLPGSTVIISSDSDDEVVTPADNGIFTLTQTIPDGTSILRITAIFPDGQEKTETRTVTFSTESF